MPSILSAIAAVLAAMLAVLSPTPRRLSPLQRARAVQWQAWAAARTDTPVTRADAVAATLDRDPVTLVEDDRNSMPVIPAGSDLATPDPEPVIPDPTPDEVVSLTAAAERLGVSIATVRRYCAPSSGRLIRLGDGVTQASLEACAATR